MDRVIVRDGRKKNFYQTDNAIIDDWLPVIKERGLTLYNIYLRLINHKTNTSFPSLNTLVKFLSWSKNTIKKYNRILERFGLIKIIIFFEDGSWEEGLLNSDGEKKDFGERQISHYEYIILDVPEITQEVIDEYYPDGFQPLCKSKDNSKKYKKDDLPKKDSTIEKGVQSLNPRGSAIDPPGSTIERGGSTIDTEKDKYNNTNIKREEEKEDAREDLDKQLWMSIFELYKKVFDKEISDFQLETLRDYISDNQNMDLEIIPLALKEAGLNNANTFSYVITTLDDWLERGLTTADKVLAMKEERTKQNQEAKQSNYKQKKTDKSDYRSKGKIRGSNNYKHYPEEEKNSEIPIDQIKERLKKFGLVKSKEEATTWGEVKRC